VLQVADGKGATDGNDGWGDMDAAPSEDTVITVRPFV